MRNVVFIGLDVDDKKFHGCAVHSGTGEVFEFSCLPDVNYLVKKIEKFLKQEVDVKVCYEATYLGFSLARDLRDRGIFCEVIAPSLIPKLAGDCVKTDRLDSQRLSLYYMKGLLTVVHEPDEETESIRDMLRSRAFLVDQAKAMKLHILSLCRRHRMSYLRETGNRCYWTVHHRKWLLEKVRMQELKSLRQNCERLLLSLQYLEQQIESYEEDLKSFAELPRYERAVRGLESFRGIGVLTAMSVIFEIGDVRRFDHPKRLVSYAGLDIREYSSGGHERKFGISKLGNSYLRKAVVSASQLAMNPVSLSRGLKKRRVQCDPQMINIADRCMERLSKKSYHLKMREKPNNKIKVACAREMLGFIWEALQKVA